MDAIKEYIQAKRDIANAKRWEDLIGSPYHGGGGGIGKVTAATTVKMEIYHQYSNGDTNYHAPPNEHLAACICKVVTNMGSTIIAKAIAIMEQELAQKAAAAQVLTIAIAADADGEPDVQDAAPSLSSTN